MKKIIWISYDLGVRGDYSGLYEWLDNHDAKECGDGVAVLQYEVNNSNLVEELKKDLSQKVKFEKRDRVYVVWQDEKKTKGRFVFGRRKSTPWQGYGSNDLEPDEDF